MPYSLASFRWSHNSAFEEQGFGRGCSRTCRQSAAENVCLFSMSAVFRPYCPARMAAVYPAGTAADDDDVRRWFSGKSGCSYIATDDDGQTFDSRTGVRGWVQTACSRRINDEKISAILARPSSMRMSKAATRDRIRIGHSRMACIRMIGPIGEDASGGRSLHCRVVKLKREKMIQGDQVTTNATKTD